MNFSSKMAKYFLPPTLAAVFATALAVSGPANANDDLVRWPGAACKPVDEATADHVLYNSRGAIANMSATEAAWIVCPVRMPAIQRPPVVFRWKGNFLTSAPRYCTLRLMTAMRGDTVASFTAAEELGDTLLFDTELGVDLHLVDNELTVSVRCELPASGDLGPAGLISYSVTSAQPDCTGEDGCAGFTRCNWENSCYCKCFPD